MTINFPWVSITITKRSHRQFEPLVRPQPMKQEKLHDTNQSDVLRHTQDGEPIRVRIDWPELSSAKEFTAGWLAAHQRRLARQGSLGKGS